ncbi:MAG: GntR family transcriptional regulator [Sphingorhabdus sp.]
MIEVDTMVDRVRRYLRNQILSGELKPGDRIVQGAVADKLGVSRIPVRESIHALVSEGLVEVEPHHGAIVAPISLHHAEEMFSVRALLEEHLLRLAFESKELEPGLKSARKFLNLMKSKRRKISEFEEWSDYHWGFHKSLYQSANQPHTLGILKNLFVHCERYLALENADAQLSNADQKDHERLLEYISTGEEEKAVETLRHHILNTPKLLQELMARKF